MTYERKFHWLTAIVVGLAILTFFCGCASLETTAYKSIGSASVTVDAAMNAWGQYVRDGKATDAQQAQVRAAYQRYQQAMQTAQKMVTLYRQTPANKPILEQALATVAEAVLSVQSLTQPLPKIP